MGFLNAMNSLGNLILAFLSHIFTGKASWHWESPIGGTVIIIIWVILGLFIGGFFAFRFNGIVGLILTPFFVAFLPVMLVLVAIGYLIFRLTETNRFQCGLTIQSIKRNNKYLNGHRKHFHKGDEQKGLEREIFGNKHKCGGKNLSMKEYLNNDFSKIRKHYGLKP